MSPHSALVGPCLDLGVHPGQGSVVCLAFRGRLDGLLLHLLLQGRERLCQLLVPPGWACGRASPGPLSDAWGSAQVIVLDLKACWEPCFCLLSNRARPGNNSLELLAIGERGGGKTELLTFMLCPPVLRAYFSFLLPYPAWAHLATQEIPGMLMLT